MNVLENLKKGAFLTTKNDGKVNTMTISWGNMGIEWGTDVFITMVRDSRYTKVAMDATNEFTITIPLDDSMRDALAFCGSKSGKDYDKIKECGLSLKESKVVGVPIINCKSIAIECRVMYTQRMSEENMTSEFKEKFYKNGDMHTFYHGEILEIYEV